MNQTLQPQNVLTVAQRLRGVVNHTPVMTSRTLNALTGARIFLKCENFQRVGAFKFRGAYNALSQLSDAEREAGVITHSSGNHAQGVALAARLLGIPAVIVMPDNAPPNKREATAGYGATIVPCPAIDREKVTAELIDRHGYTLIHPYDNDNIILGQGTAAVELFEEVGELDLLLLPVGGGGLISGSALAAAALSPGCRVLGVEPQIAADAYLSWRENRVVTLDHVPQTIADGLRTRYIGDRNLAVMHHYVHEMLTVTEAQIIETLAFIWSYLKIVVEPSSAVALAPLLTGALSAEGMRVGVVLSGGNFSLPLAEIFPTQPAESAGVAPDRAAERKEKQPRILVTDRKIDPGALDKLRSAAAVDLVDEEAVEDLERIIDRYEALIVAPHQRVTAQTIGYGFNLLAIGCPSTHLDNIDVSAARSFGIELCYEPGGNAVAIAEDTLARLLRLDEQFDLGGLSGKTLGLIGFGSTGSQVAKLAAAFNMEVLVNQPRLTPELALAAGVKAADLADLLANSDFVSLHVPFNPETEAMIGQEELAYVKPTAFLINPGHTDLIDEFALLDALQNGRIAGASLSALPQGIQGTGETADLVRSHDRVVVAPHVTAIIERQRPALYAAVAEKVVEILNKARSGAVLPLELVPADLVTPHEEIDEKRVRRLMERLDGEKILVNPPITMRWKGRYVVLDGATRFTALSRLGYRHLIVQVVEAQQADLRLHTWYHAVSHSDASVSDLLQQLRLVPGLVLEPLPEKGIRAALSDRRTLCYFLDAQGSAFLAREDDGADRMAVMKEMVRVYTDWGTVERTLLTDLPRLKEQFPNLKAVAVFPQFEPGDVYNAATAGDFLPAGLTRFIIPGRILRLNADLERLGRQESIAEKRAWFNSFLAQKLERSRLRFYQEPVVLLDE